jgi:hypothetical protein
MASFIMAGRFQAVAFISLVALLSVFIAPLALFSNAAVALVALRRGTNQAATVMLIASVLFTVVFFVLSANASLVFASTLLQWSLMIVLASTLTRSVSWTYTLQIILLIVVGGLTIFHLSVSDTQTFWEGTEFWKASVKPFAMTLAEGQQWTDKETASFLKAIPSWLAVGFLVDLLVTSIVSLLIARYWQSLLFNKGGFGKEFRELRVGKIPAMAWLLSVILFAVTQSQLIAGISLLGMAVFLLQGLAVIHGLVNKMQMNNGWLAAMYILLIPIFPNSAVMIVLLVLFGLIDNVTDFRNTLGRKT